MTTTTHTPSAALSRGIARSRRGTNMLALCVVVAVAAAAVAAAVVGLRTPVYESTATLSIDQPRAIAVSADAGVIDKLSRLRMKYAGLVSTVAFAKPVADHFGRNPVDVSHQLFARAVGDSLLIDVGAHASNETTSRELAGAAAAELIAYVDKEQTSNGIPREFRFSFSIVTAAAGGHRISPDVKSIAGAAGLTALVVFGALLALLSLRTRED